MKKFDMSLLTISLLILGLLLLGMSEKEEPIVAKVNGTAISESRYFAELSKQHGEQILDQLVVETLIKQEADKKKITVTQDEINDELTKMKAQMGTPEMFEQFLAQYQMTEEQLKERIKQNVLLDKMFKDELQVTEEEMRAFFEENKASFGQPAPTYEQVKAQIKEVILENKKQYRIPAWIEEARKTAKIEKTGESSQK